MLQPEKRFSNRVGNYVKFRPTYPASLLQFMQQEFALPPGAMVADVGSGTGILTALLLQQQWEVFGVEPNEPMRLAAETALANEPLFHSINATGEQTTLPGASMALITVAQAFHWLQPAAARKEFARILQPGGHVALIWNLRLLDSPFGQAFEAIKKTYGTDYEKIRKAHEPELADFFAPAPLAIKSFRHAQYLDLDGLKGQLLSSSYMPLENQPGYTEMIQATTDLYNRFQQNGMVEIAYETKLHYNAGPLG
ncbi:class I SAM-dependent methyltransferase [Deminuibacter soli]|uniref:Class I SAM-dependent methyltransferase n=1 Tax=Deminuibacter soli TaxID=2291815 RepID=A0A3E1NNX0_9BACT|nr:class I SAM-dependent methyltransferase [Deminuibacter soli]RFM29524.1 class I SAM-dependent methyltransferase [Deminuibacter soli]